MFGFEANLSSGLRIPDEKWKISGSHKSCDMAEGDTGRNDKPLSPSSSFERDAISSANLIIVEWEVAKCRGSVTVLTPGSEGLDRSRSMLLTDSRLRWAFSKCRCITL